MNAPLIARPPRRHPIRASEFRLPLTILRQPDETTCGPTCLHAVYTYWGEKVPLSDIIARNYRMEHGGTYAVYLACDALRHGYAATIYTYNLLVFDPTWFRRDVDISEKLTRQLEFKMERRRFEQVTPAYLEFLELGGRLRFMDLSPTLIHRILRRRLPIVTGLSSTYLYHASREYGPDDIKDDVRGTPSGHFVVIAGYDAERRRVLIVDPYQPHPYGKTHEYWIGIDRAVGAVLLGIVTHDANLLIIHPPPGSA
ncbi:MAG TPA: C39 family peptidase [Burkholderiales bacterium]|nr:C39 family peptidase [Burkholderiales bacterium]